MDRRTHPSYTVTQGSNLSWVEEPFSETKNERENQGRGRH